MPLLQSPPPSEQLQGEGRGGVGRNGRRCAVIIEEYVDNEERGMTA
jgi:hypothetical protein